MERCPSLREWLDYEEGRLAPADAAGMQIHLTSACVSCESQRAWVRRLLSALPQTTEQPLSAESRSYLRELAAARLTPRPRPLWIARLLPEIQRPFQLARAQGEEEAIQLRYSVEQYDIRLWAEPSAANRWYLIGQVFSQAENAFVSAEEAILHSNDGAALNAQPEETEFHFPAVVSGAYRLEIRLPESYLLAPEVILA